MLRRYQWRQVLQVAAPVPDSLVQYQVASLRPARTQICQIVPLVLLHGLVLHISPACTLVPLNLLGRTRPDKASRYSSEALLSLAKVSQNASRKAIGLRHPRGPYCKSVFFSGLHEQHESQVNDLSHPDSELTLRAFDARVGIDTFRCVPSESPARLRSKYLCSMPRAAC